MARDVFCRKYQASLPGLVTPPMPGPIGLDVWENVSEKAWKEWQELQTMLINENQLTLFDPDSRKWLMAQMKLFFSNADYAKPSGYIPPKT